MPDTSTHLLLPYLLAAQAQKHVTVNEALRLLDGLVQLAVLGFIGLCGALHDAVSGVMQTTSMLDNTVRLVAGCDKRAVSCHNKFSNFVNFRGFPHLPSEDWIMAPQAGGRRG